MFPISSSRLRWHFRAFVVALYLLAEAPWSFGGTKVVDEEMISKWKAYERFSRSLQGMARITISTDSGKTEESIIYKQNRDCTLSCLSDGRSLTDRYRIGNPRYAASIKRDKSDPTQVVLDKFTQDPYDAFPGTSGYKMSVFDLNYRGISPHFTVGAVPLAQFVIAPMYEFTKVTKEMEDGRELIRIDYTSSYNDSQTESQSKGSGSLLLDPSHCWCLRRLKTSSKSTRKGAPVRDAEHIIEFEVIEHPSGFPVVKTQLSRDITYLYKTKKRWVSTTKTDYEWKVDDTVPDSEFTLTAFGLPEPGSEPVKKTVPLYVWVLVAAGVCAALALGFRYLAQRRSRSQPLT